MTKEFKQPNIAKLDLKDPFTWASAARVHAEWTRQVGLQLGVDIEKYILGDVLVSIIGDDANCFTWTVGGDFFDSDIASKAKSHLLERMDWEIGTPETPQRIRKRLRSVYQAASSFNWEKIEEFEQAKIEWFQLKEWVEEQINESLELKEAKEYMLTTNQQLLGKYWVEFLHG